MTAASDARRKAVKRANRRAAIDAIGIDAYRQQKRERAEARKREQEAVAHVRTREQRIAAAQHIEASRPRVGDILRYPHGQFRVTRVFADGGIEVERVREGS